MTNKEKFNYIIDQMVVMGETGHMKTLPYLNVNNFARDIIREEGVTPGELTDRIKQGLLDAGVKDKFDANHSVLSLTIPTSRNLKQQLSPRNLKNRR